MLTKIRRWGNSQGLRFTKAVLEEARIGVGDRVRVSVREGRIIVEPVATVRGRHDLKTLVSAMPEGIGQKRRDWRPPRRPGPAAGAVSCAHEFQTQAAHRHPDLPRDPRGRLLLRRQNRLHRSAARRRQALFPVPSAALRQEPVPGHPEGALRGQRGAVRGAGHPRTPGLFGASSGAAAQLRLRQLQGAGLPPPEPDGATGRRRAPDGGGLRIHHRAGTVRLSSGNTASPDRPAGGGAGGRVRQADPGCARRAGTWPARTGTSCAACIRS